MNLIGFLAIVIAGTGVIWILQLLLRGNDRIDINFSVGRQANRDSNHRPDQDQPKATNGPATMESVLGEVVSFGGKPKVITVPSDSEKSSLVDETSRGVITGEKGNHETSNTSQSTPDQASGAPEAPLANAEDSYIDQALQDETFEDQTNDSLLEETTDDQLTPPIGRITYSPFSAIAEQLPAGSFDQPQPPQQIEAMFAVLRESTLRIEEQMIAMYAVQRSLLDHAAQSLRSSSPVVQSGREDSEATEEYSFDDEANHPSFGGGLNAQLNAYPDGESTSAPTTEYIGMDELGVDLPSDAFQTFDVSEISEPAPEPSKEILPYLASLNTTGELSHAVVDAVKRKAPTREVKHHIRQVLRAIDHFDLSGDANAALRVTAVLRQLPEELGEYNTDLAAIGRKFGLAEPEDEPVSVEMED